MANNDKDKKDLKFHSLTIAFRELQRALVSIDEIGYFNILDDELAYLQLFDKKSKETFFGKVKAISDIVLLMPDKWSGDLEEAMKIDLLTSIIEPLWENFESEWINFNSDNLINS